jgi:spermidine synthase
LNIRPRIALGFCQLFLVMTISYAAYMLTSSIPYWPIDPSMSASPWYNFQLDLLRCVWALLPAACFWGASFPLALGAATQKGQDPGKLVGGVYAANTVGAIIGAVFFSMIVVPKIGTQQAQRLLIGLSAVSALLMFLPPLCQFKEKYSLETNNVFARGVAFIVILLIIAGLTTGFAWGVHKVPWGLIAQGRFLPTNSVYDDSNPLYMGEGMNASIAISELPSGVRSFHVSGKVVASNDPQDMKLQLMLGHLPALFHPKPRSILVVGCGAGVTAGSFITHPDVERIVICEIEPLIPKTAAEYFSEENNHVVDDPRVEIIYDDARHYILTTDEKFDIITSDPIHPWVKGAAALYTKEYFNLCKQRLNEGGIATQWVPLYESNTEAVKSELATFFEVFQEGTIWGNDYNGEGYDVVLLGYAQTATIDVNDLQQRLNSEEYSEVQRSLSTIGFATTLNMLSKYAGRGQDLKSWLEDAIINTDRNLRLQYLAGMGLNLYDERNIYQDMLAHRQFPEDLFIATDGFKLELSREIERW